MILYSELHSAPHQEKKLILLNNENMIEYSYNQISIEPLPFKLFNESYGFIYRKDMYFLHLTRKFKQKRIKFKERQIILDKSKPPLMVEKWDGIYG